MTTSSSASASTSDDDVRSFFGANSTYPLRLNVWTQDDLSMGRAVVHHYQCHSHCHTLSSSLQKVPREEQSNIPQLIHFIWLGNKPLPLTRNNADDDGENECIRSWRRYHPKWMIQVWRDDDIMSYTNSKQKWFNAAALQYALSHENYGMASDILRLELLWEHGGLYVDIDYLCVDAMDDLHHHTTKEQPFVDFYCGASRTFAVEVNNGLIGARPHHPLVKRMMERIQTWFANFLTQSQPFDMMAAFLDPSSRSTLEQVMALTDLDVIRNTGPGLLTTTLAQALMDPSIDMSRVAILPFQVFHPLPNFCRGRNMLQEEQLLEEHIVRGQTKAVHLWQCSWQNKTTAAATTAILG